MARYLLDTHILIWHLIDSNNLHDNIRSELEDYSNKFYLSPISLMEIAIKNREKDIDFIGFDYKQLIKNISNYGIELLELRPRHFNVLNQLTYPSNHKDPFDHTIISQAIDEKMCLISADRKFPFYKTQGLELLENC